MGYVFIRVIKLCSYFQTVNQGRVMCHQVCTFSSKIIWSQHFPYWILDLAIFSNGSTFQGGNFWQFVSIWLPFFLICFLWNRYYWILINLFCILSFVFYKWWLWKIHTTTATLKAVTFQSSRTDSAITFLVKTEQEISLPVRLWAKPLSVRCGNMNHQSSSLDTKLFMWAYTYVFKTIPGQRENSICCNF